MIDPEQEKRYEIVSFSRTDLSHLGLSGDQVNRLTDAQMHMIALAMHERFVDGEFWSFLVFLTKLTLQEGETPRVTDL